MAPKSEKSSLGTSDKSDSAPLSLQEEEAMSSALIAQLLAEDGMDADHHGYYNEYSNDRGVYESRLEGRYNGDSDASFEHEEEDDVWDPKNKARSKKPKRAEVIPKTPKARGRKRKDADADGVERTLEDGDAAAAASETNGNGEEVKQEKQKKVKPKKVKLLPDGQEFQYKTGVYDEQEEARFLEALELYGRDWGKLEEHIGTRDANSIRSHAQKHFIKLFRDGIELPAKVKESGGGYTLSGKELDPNSAAAKPYLSRMNLEHAPVQPKKGETKAAPAALAEPNGNLLPENVSGPLSESAAVPNGASSATQQAEDKDQAAFDATNPALQPQRPLQPVQTPQENNKKASTPKLTPPKREKERKEVYIPSDAYEEDGRTGYSKRKLRQNRDKGIFAAQLAKEDVDPHTMVKCEPFVGTPNSGVFGCQPFHLNITSNVLVEMDFHAHLMTSEIIGFLAGHWDQTTKEMHIKVAFPCQSLPTGQNFTNVEMDPEDAIRVRQTIEDLGLSVLGWYHSHPTFAPDPSLVDIENQTNYQLHSKEDGTGLEPFVGAIIGPYDPRLPASQSVINWFYVSDNSLERGKPKRLTYQLHESTDLESECKEKMISLLSLYKTHPEKVNFKDFWRHDAHETKLDKLIRSLAKRMPWVQKRLAQKVEEDKENIAANETIDVFLETLRQKLAEW